MIAVRLASLDDCAAIARVHIESSRRGHEGLMPASYLAWLDSEYLSPLWAERLRVPDRTRTWVATEADEVIGYAWVCPAELPDEDASELDLLYVAPHKWGSGVAQQLMSAVIEWLRDIGKPSAILWTMEGDQRARRFYEKCGWFFDGSRGIMTLDGTGVPIVRYRLLTSASSKVFTD